jgi:hypothetical protein
VLFSLLLHRDTVLPFSDALFNAPVIGQTHLDSAENAAEPDVGWTVEEDKILPKATMNVLIVLAHPEPK